MIIHRTLRVWLMTLSLGLVISGLVTLEKIIQGIQPLNALAYSSIFGLIFGASSILVLVRTFRDKNSK